MAKQISGIVVITLIIGLLVSMIWPFLRALSWAAVLAVVFYPIVRSLMRSFKLKAWQSSMLICLGTLLLFAGLVIPMIVVLTNELTHFASGVEEFVKRPDLEKQAILAGFFPSGEVTVWGYSFDFSRVRMDKAKIVLALREYEQFILSSATALATGLVRVVADALIVFILLFFLLRDGESIGKQLRERTYLLGGKRALELLQVMQATVLGAVYGILATAAAQGVLAGIAYFVLGAPLPLLLSCLTMVMSLVPMGTPLVYLPVAFYLMYYTSYTVGVIMLLWGILVVSTADNIFRSFFISQTTSLPIICSLIGLLGGVLSFGFVGVILGPMIMAASVTLWNKGFPEFGGEAPRNMES